ncbi:mitochondrial import inner membrane translocase subunit Tim21 [Prorops nasuta]|uniref:mitochondrial import inner membrane translocase subunit Tim21 n=1 Tax=Prorops nasuta TaxID=863751 RepID=UPI0034D01B17
MASYRIFNHTFLKRYLFVANKNCMPSLTASAIMDSRTNYSTKKSIVRSSVKEENNKLEPGLAKVVKENTKSIGYLGVIIGGIGVTLYIFYVIFKELFSSNSVNGIYTRALEKCISDTRIVDALGKPIKAYGEESRRGRRRHVSHTFFLKDGKKHLRMRFYIQGIRRRGTVDLEMEEDASGNYDYTYLYVKIDDVLGSIIKVEDNRFKESNRIDFGSSSLPEFS